MPNSAFDEPIIELANAHTPAIIQVIGVGGGGGNAVAHMYREGFMDVQYTVVNSDKKALSDSPVPDRVQLGPGLGAGGNPEKGRELCEESIEAVRSMLGKQTQMVFITAGMGGGTGTGASPIIARETRERGILTIGVVTIPFLFELTPRINKALDGVYALAKEVDALLVINNERLRDIYPELSVYNAFRRADDTLLTAVKSIVDIICMHGTMNLDFCDVDTVLRGGRVAIMSTAYAEGERRVTKAINAALHSPLLNNNDIFNSKKIIISITSSNAKPLSIEELSELDAFMRKFRPDVITKYGLATDNGLDLRQVGAAGRRAAPQARRHHFGRRRRAPHLVLRQPIRQARETPPPHLPDWHRRPQQRGFARRNGARANRAAQQGRLRPHLQQGHCGTIANST